MEKVPDHLVRVLQEEHDQALMRALTSVGALLDRVLTEGSAVYYDPEDDRFILVVDPLEHSVILEADDDLWLRVTPDSDQIIGFEVPRLRQAMESHPEAAEHLRWVFQHAQQNPGAFVRIPVAATARLANDLRELIPA